VQIPVLIEPVAGDGYRARGLGPDTLTAEGTTREEALEKLRQRLQDQLAAGAQVVTLEVPGTVHPLARAAGIFRPDDPLVEEWEQIMAENRKRDDEALGIR
jgi:hypothetical protein